MHKCKSAKEAGRRFAFGILHLALTTILFHRRARATYWTCKAMPALPLLIDKPFGGINNRSTSASTGRVSREGFSLE
jgi:hypothetical protein